MSALAFKLMADAVEVLKNKLNGYMPAASGDPLPLPNAHVSLAKIALNVAVQQLRAAAEDDAHTGEPHVKKENQTALEKLAAHVCDDRCKDIPSGNINPHDPDPDGHRTEWQPNVLASHD